MDNCDIGISLDLLLCGIREPHSIERLFLRLGKEDIFYDVGANLGYYTVIVAKRVNKVVSFEPFSKSFELLKKNVELNNLHNVKLFKFGLGERTEDKILYVPAKKNWASFYNDLWPKSVKDKELARLFSLDNFVESFKEVPPPTWIKMDIEGYEYFLIKGAIKTIKRYRPRFLMEVYPKILGRDRLKELIKILLDLGYNIDDYVLDTQKAPIFKTLDKKIEKLWERVYRNILPNRQITLERLYNNRWFLEGHIGGIEIFLSRV